MDLLHALILGVVEGFTEFLPISSTAHLILTSHALGLAESEFVKSFEIIIQLGAILSVVVLYWRKFLDWEVLTKIAVAFLPTGIIGLTLYKVVKGYLLGNLTIVLLSLAIGGVVLIVLRRFEGDDRAEVDFSEITYGRAILVGLFQSIAIVPGVSRAAATIVGGVMIGISKRTIVEFSFMLAVPTMLGASVLDLIKSHGALAGNGAALAMGFVVSFVMAILAIASFLAFIKRRDFSWFGWYRIVLAAVYYVVAFLR